MPKFQLFPTPDSLFVARDDGTLIKIRGLGGSGQNMFAVLDQDGTIVGCPGYDYWCGTQRFDASVVGLVFSDGVTVIGLANGKMLKVRQQGGTGQNMFALRESDVGFEGEPDYDYLMGSQVFVSNSDLLYELEGMWHVEDVLFVALALYDRSNFEIPFIGSILLKFRGFGGTGSNMFAIREEGGTLTGECGYDYWLGAQHFKGHVNELVYADGATVIGLSDGRILKIRGQGGTGQNMFAVAEASTGFASVPGYDYLLGSQRLTSEVIGLWKVDEVLYLALKNGALFKVQGTGGTGANMFSILEDEGTITGMPGSEYWIGTQQFGDRVTGLASYEGATVIGLADGRMLKVREPGGAGQNMFAVTEATTGFASLPGYQYLLGNQYFKQGVEGLWQVGGTLFVTLGDGTLIKVRGTGGTGENMLAVREEEGAITGEPGYDYWIGTQQEMFRFVVFGDSQDEGGLTSAGVNGNLFRPFLDEVSKYKPDVIFFLGDMSDEPELEEWEIWRKFMKPLKRSGTKIFNIPGNHEKGDGDDFELEWQERYREWCLHNMPKGIRVESPPGYEGLAYWFEFKDSAFVILDSFYIEPENGIVHHGVTQEQLDWFEQKVAHARKAHIFAFSHRPAWSMSREPKDDPALFAWALKNQIDMLLSGHEHLYARCRLGGAGYPVQITSGGAGGAIASRDDLGYRHHPDCIYTTHNFVVIDVRGRSVSIRAFKGRTCRGEPLDTYAFVK